MSRSQKSIETLLRSIDEPNGSACFQILNDNIDLFKTVQGSTDNHQAWPGGYYNHIQEIMNIVEVLYETLNAIRPLPFSLSDALLVTYLHDIEKPWKYTLGEDGKLYHVHNIQTKQEAHDFRLLKLTQYGIALTPDQLNGLTYVEGELSGYSSRNRVMNPLAALCHMADVASARIWFNHPLTENDPWIGALRIK